MKLCRDCKYVERFGLFRRVEVWSRCNHAASLAETLILVTGDIRRAREGCVSMRHGQCGPEARLFEPREAE